MLQNVGGVLNSKIQAPERPGLSPAMRGEDSEIQAVAGHEPVMALIALPDLQFAAQVIQKFFAFMNITFAGPPARFDAEQVGLHGGFTPGK